MTSYQNLPDISERKGSLFLRSDHMNYSRATLNSNWHQAREAEPRDYNLSKAPYRDLCKSTYNRIGNVTDGTLPNTTYVDFSQQVLMKDQFAEKDVKQHMITEDTFASTSLNRVKKNPNDGAGEEMLPGHHPEHDKQFLETTHRTDYTPPYPYNPAEEGDKLAGSKCGAEEKPQDSPDYSMALKRCHSQFTDTADARRKGWNTWQDESGHYANSHYKAQCPVYHTPNPILKAFQQQ